MRDPNNHRLHSTTRDSNGAGAYLAEPAPSTAPPGSALAPLLVDAREAARLLAVSPRTLWALTASGAVPAVRLGRSVRYAPADLAAYVERLREGRG